MVDEHDLVPVPVEAPPVQVIRYGPAASQFGELRSPAQPGSSDSHPVAVLLHGGFWRADWGLELMRAMAADLHHRGWATWNLEYRRIGEDGITWRELHHDVALGVDHLREVRVAASLGLRRVVIIGHSAGGQLALWCAARLGWTHEEAGHHLGLIEHDPVRPRAVVAQAPVVSLAQAHAADLSDEGNAVARLLGGGPSEVPSAYGACDPAERLPTGVPTLIVSGSDDRAVPSELITAHADRATAAGDPIERLVLADCDHFGLIDPGHGTWPQQMAALEALIA